MWSTQKEATLGFDLNTQILLGKLTSGCIGDFERNRSRALAHVYGQIVPGEKIALIAMGGGGDCIGTSIAARDLVKEYGAQVAILGLTLKRPSQTETDKPLGCLPISQFSHLLSKGEFLKGSSHQPDLPHIGFVTPETLGPNKLLIDEVRLLKHCQSSPDWRGFEPLVGLIDPSPGVTAVTKELRQFLKAGGYTKVGASGFRVG